MKLSIYCCKPLVVQNPYMIFTDCSTLEEFTQRKHFEDLTGGNSELIFYRDGNFHYKIFLKQNPAKNPKWRDFIFDGVIGSGRRTNPVTKSCSGIILLKCLIDNQNERIFVITFGSGSAYIDENAVEENFGLKVVLNSISIKNLQLVDKKNIGSNTKQVKEAYSSPTNVKNFDINKFIDKLTFVEGCPDVGDQARLGKRLGGRDPVLVDMSTSFGELGRLCKTYYESWLGTEYETKGFGFIDNYTSKIDSSITEQLNEQLWHAILNNSGNISLSPKDIIQMIEQIEQFEVSVGSYTQLFTSLNFQDIFYFIQSRLPSDLEQFEERVKIQGKDGDGNAITSKTSLKKYIIFEVTVGGKQYILHEGTWYEVKQDYYDQIQQKITTLQSTKIISNANYLVFNGSIYRDANGNKSEGLYNLAQGSESGFYCIDKDLYRGFGSGIEVGDLIYNNGGETNLIHVKRHSGSSALSHLFAQGKVSNEALKNDDTYYNHFANSFITGFPGIDVPNKDDVKTVYGFISNMNNLNQLPFFSKINLINTVDEIEKYRGEVGFVFIPETN